MTTTLKSGDVYGARMPVRALMSDAPESVKTPVCQVRVNRMPGTGFLVAPDVVLTSYHLMAEVLEGVVRPGDVTVLFDHGPSETWKLARDFRLAASPPSRLDEVIDPGGEPTAAELDHVLLRLDGSPGEVRGFLRPSKTIPVFAPGSPLHIVQYPNGQGLMVAHQEDGVIEVNPERTRVRYRTWTTGASSGSPCFDGAWQLVAMHHATSPNRPVPLYNQGIPIHTLRDSLPAAVRRELGW
ncbi:MAG TPA: serine protease [Candidatus Nanopelagicales bacterium]|nr:serine protease [Candidatus Nanopelagicales bacterium]